MEIANWIMNSTGDFGKSQTFQRMNQRYGIDSYNIALSEKSFLLSDSCMTFQG